MKKFKRLIALATLCTPFFSSSALALIVAGFPLSIGVDGGVTDVKYKGQSETGYFWAVNGNLKLNDYSSIYSGYGETSADIPDALGVDQKFTSRSIPLAVQLNLPLIPGGNVYLRAGGNYYQNTYVNDDESGWGLLGAVGIRLTPGAGPGVAIELTFQDRGNAETSSVAVGAKFGF